MTCAAAGASPTWEAFRLRLRRAQSPDSVWPVLAPATGAEVYIPEPREVLAPPEGKGNAVQVPVANLGLDRAALRITVFERSGAPIGDQLPRKVPWLEPGEHREIRLTLNREQARALAGGGSLVASPGTLPESHRRLSQVRSLRPRFTTLEWRFPAAYWARLEVPAGGDGELSAATPALELRGASGAPTPLLLEIRRFGGTPAVELFLPPAPVHYRLVIGRGSPPQREEGEWRSVVPDFLERTWGLANPTGLRIAGRLQTEPGELVVVTPDRIDLAPGEEVPVRLSLGPKALAAAAPLPGTVRLGFHGTAWSGSANETHTDQPDLLRISLQRQRFEGRGVRWRGPVPATIEALSRPGSERTVELALENPGTDPCILYLDFADGSRSSPVILPPPTPSAGEPEPVRFAIPANLVVGEDGTEATLAAQEPLVWEPNLLVQRFQVRVFDDAVAEAGDLRWHGPEPAEARERKARIRLVFRHQRRRRLPVQITRVVLLENGFPRQTLHPMRVVAVGRTVEVVSAEVRVWSWTHATFRAEVTLTNGQHSVVLVKTMVLKRVGGAIEMEQLSSPAGSRAGSTR